MTAVGKILEKGRQDIEKILEDMKIQAKALSENERGSVERAVLACQAGLAHAMPTAADYKRLIDQLYADEGPSF